MKKIFLLPAVAVLIVGGAYLLADNDRYEESDFVRKYSLSNVKKVPMNAQEKLYINECGSCHMAYQKEFLPKRSWNKMLNTLEDHFGVDATLEPEDKKTLSKYLIGANSKYLDRHITKMKRSIRTKDTPLRISDTPYFKKEHRGIPAKFIKQKEVKSIANCNACHINAQNGDYGERSIFIPNYGRWDD